MKPTFSDALSIHKYMHANMVCCHFCSQRILIYIDFKRMKLKQLKNLWANFKWMVCIKWDKVQTLIDALVSLALLFFLKYVAKILSNCFYFITGLTFIVLTFFSFHQKRITLRFRVFFSFAIKLFSFNTTWKSYFMHSQVESVIYVREKVKLVCGKKIVEIKWI